MQRQIVVAGSALALILLGCGDSDAPTGAEDHTVELDEAQAELTLSADHVHTLNEITFTALLTDHHGEALHEVDSVWVERRLVGDDRWRGTELAASDGAFTGAYTFATSGEYEVRVVAKNAGDAEATVLYEMTEHLHVGRAHVEAGGLRVEFESYPGHIHQGDTGTLRFWVLAAERDANGERPAIAGLDAEIHCDEEGGISESHADVDIGDGLYEVEHAFATAGEFHAELHFPGLDGTEGQAEFHFHVAHGH